MSARQEADSIEQLLLELHGYLSRFEELKQEVDDACVRVADLSDTIEPDDSEYRAKIVRISSAERALRQTNWEIAGLNECVEKVIDGLETAHEELND